MLPCRNSVRWMSAAFAVFFVAIVASGRGEPIDVPLSPELWTISQRNFKIPEPEPPQHNGEAITFFGKPSYHLARGLATSRGAELRNGTIDVDFAADDRTRFFGIAFHVHSDDEYEVVFFRPRNSDTEQAVQYTPGLLGANVWQLYTGPGYTAAAHLPRNEWIHAQIVIMGATAKLFLNHSTEPTLVVQNLKLGQTNGGVGFWGHLGGGYFANLQISPDDLTYDAEVKPHFDSRVLSDWELSDAFDATTTPADVFPKVRQMKWEKVHPEDAGMVVINRYRRSPNIDTLENQQRIKGEVTGAQVVFARTTIRSDRERTAKLRFGYSDDVTLFLNGKPIYSGNNELGFRQYNFLGLLNPYADTVYLPLRKGENELVLGVTEFFGGWGFQCELVE